VRVLLDSGAFSDPAEQRLSLQEALERQLAWERSAAASWLCPGWQAQALCSYDSVVREKWTVGADIRPRQAFAQAQTAVADTIAAAAFLASRRKALAPRRLVLTCQGIDAWQYGDCARSVLTYARPGDTLGLGGWCPLGRHTSALPEFWRTAWQVVPAAAEAGLSAIHLFGVLYLPALGGLLWLCDAFCLDLSVDSTAPVLATTRANPKKAGVRGEVDPTSGRASWRSNVQWWTRMLSQLRTTKHYRRPPLLRPIRQLELPWEPGVCN
jgi:hypothetical protein